MLTEWLKIMLDEIASKQEQAQRAREAALAHEQQAAPQPEKKITAPA